MDKEEIAEGEGATESSLAIADAIYAGFIEVARSIDRFTTAFNGDGEPEPERLNRYLDGSPMK